MRGIRRKLGDVLRFAAVLLMLTGVIGLNPTIASAHGPCECVFPVDVVAGQQISVGRAEKVVWNPRPDDFQNQTSPVDLASGFRTDAPSEVVFESDRPVRRARFSMPAETPPGIYFVLIFDGSEGGSHTTWDYVQVRGRPSPQPADATPSATPLRVRKDGVSDTTAVLGGAAALVAGLLVGGVAVAYRMRSKAADR